MNEYNISSDRSRTTLSSQRRSFYYGGFYYVFYTHAYGGGYGSEDIWYKCAATVEGLETAAENTVFGIDVNMGSWELWDLYLDRTEGIVGFVTGGALASYYRYGVLDNTGVITWTGGVATTPMFLTANHPHIARLNNGIWVIGTCRAIDDVWRVWYSNNAYPENLWDWTAYGADAQINDPQAPVGSDFVRLAPCGTGNAWVEIFDGGAVNGVSIREFPYYPVSAEVHSGVDCNWDISEPVVDSAGVVWFVGMEGGTNRLFLFKYETLTGAIVSEGFYQDGAVVSELSLSINTDDSMLFVGRVGNTLVARLYLRGQWLDVGNNFALGIQSGTGVGADSTFDADGNADPLSGGAPLSVAFDADVLINPNGQWLDVAGLFDGSTIADVGRDGYDPFFRNVGNSYELLVAFSDSPVWDVYIVQTSLVTPDWIYS